MIEVSSKILMEGPIRVNCFQKLALFVSTFFLASSALAQVTHEAQKLTASDAAGGDEFGYSVSASADVLVVGAPGKDVLFGTWVEGMGAAYVFGRTPNNVWQEQARLIPLDGGTPAEGDSASLGWSVATNGESVLAGAPGESAVYVYAQDEAGGWPQIQKIGRPGRAGFGTSLAVSGDRLIVAATQSVHFFRYDVAKAIWEETGDFISSLPGSGFGSSVAIDGDLAVVGALTEVYLGASVGAAHVFRWIGDKWIHDSVLHADGLLSGEEFGHSVGVSETTILVSASRADLGGGAGRAYLFDRVDSIWQLSTELAAEDTLISGEFGWSVSLEPGAALIGDNYYDGCCGDVGRAYVFTPDAKGWGKAFTLEASDAQFWDLFGNSTAIAGGTILVGANFEDEMGITSGAAYVFELDIDHGGGEVSVPLMSSFGILILSAAMLVIGGIRRKG